MYLLFSDQTLLSYNERTKSEYSTLFELLINEKCQKNDFKNYKIESIDWLIGRGAIIHNEDDSIDINKSRVYLLSGYTLPTIWACSGLSPVRLCPCRAN